MNFTNKGLMNFKKVKNPQIFSASIINSVKLIMDNNQVKSKKHCKKDANILKIN